MPREGRAKRAIAAIYSAAAERFYEPIVVQGAFKLFGGNVNDLVLDQGRRAVEVAGGGPILDMPVGTAYFTVHAARSHPGIVVGSDIAEGMVRQAHRAATEAGVANLAVVQGDAHHLPFRTGSFAAILCTNGLQVMPGLRPTVAELARVLRPGGILLVSVITLPAPTVYLSRGVPQLPTMMLRGRDVARVIEDAGLAVDSLTKQRLATLIEARKP